MRRIRAIISILVLTFGLIGCTEKEKSLVVTDAKVRLVETKTDAQDSYFRIEVDLEKMESDAFGQGIYDELEKEWKEFHSLTQEQLWVSSHFWGSCSTSFDTWEEAVAFLGVSVPNPLEEMSDLVDADSSAIPLDAEGLGGQGRHARIEWYGTEEKQIEQACLYAGYLDGTVRVALSATLYGGDEEVYTTGGGWAESVTFENEMVPMKNGNTALVIIPNDSGSYYSADAFFVQDNVLYALHLVGPELLHEEVMKSLEKVLDVF